MKVVENDLRVVTKGRREVENQAQKMLAQGMETQVRFIWFVFILDGILFLYFSISIQSAIVFCNSLSGEIVSSLWNRSKTEGKAG